MNRVSEILDIVVRVFKLGEYDSNVIGMAGEIIAEDVFGMRKTSRGKKAVDGYWKCGDQERTVQVKAWSESRVKKYKDKTFFRINGSMPPDELLVLLIYSSHAGYEVLYKGPTNAVGYIGVSKKYGECRVVRFGAIRSRAEIQQLLAKL